MRPNPYNAEKRRKELEKKKKKEEKKQKKASAKENYEHDETGEDAGENTDPVE